ncbi:MAG: hypothetical protein COA57_01625 [Flavobacteriales bacterium]|nr:MAG: hypothetical protein COA57_01625 [Flavobacteriales bacterium]
MTSKREDGFYYKNTKDIRLIYNRKINEYLILWTSIGLDNKEKFLHLKLKYHSTDKNKMYVMYSENSGDPWFYYVSPIDDINKNGTLKIISKDVYNEVRGGYYITSLIKRINQ